MIVHFAYLKESIAHHRCCDFLTQKCIDTNKMTTIENLQIDFFSRRIHRYTTVLLEDYSNFVCACEWRICGFYQRKGINTKDSIGEISPFEPNQLKDMDMIYFYYRVQRQV